ncbi:MAG: hypothetical protein LBU15_04600 [Rickettsiales bacterium]|jgi:hypothetical protein|nr:hypothetical protein [Rickettsiales bacterium]
MRIGIAKMYVKNAQLDYNFAVLERLYGEALEKKLEIVIFPRLATSGFFDGTSPVDESYLEKIEEYTEKVISLTEGRGTKILLGTPLQQLTRGEEGEISRTELKDSALFIDGGHLDTEIFRKEIDRDNPLDDYRYFDRHRFLKHFSYRNKKFLVLLADDIYSNFNLLLAKDSEPDYVLCLDSSATRSREAREKHLLKLAKFANSPLFYLNSASYSGGLLFRGEVVLIDEDFRVVFEDFYRGDELVPFEIDCEDGTELFIRETGGGRGNPFHVLEKYFGPGRVVLDVDLFSDLELEEMGKNGCELVTFSGESGHRARFIEMTNYINGRLFERLTAKEQNMIKGKIVDLLATANHDQ